MDQQPQIGDRITARHLLHTSHCDILHAPEVHGYVQNIGKYAIHVVDTGRIVIIHSKNGWDIQVHPEISNERG